MDADWLRVIQAPGLPFEPLPGGWLVNSWLQRDLISRLHKMLEDESTWLAVGRPSGLSVNLCQHLHGRRVMYDVMDDTPGFLSGMSKSWMQRMHLELAQQAEVLWCSASALQANINKATGRQAALVRNGNFAPSVSKGQPLGPPWIFGYVGTLAFWFDWDWVIKLATALPDAEIRLYGPLMCKAPPDLPSNIQIHGPVSNETALALMADWHVGLIPFQKNKLTESVDPVKYYEYRAAGLPVLSTRFGEMNWHARDEAVWFLEDVDLASLPQRLINWADVPVARTQLDTTWNSRFDQAGLTAGWLTAV